MSKKIATAARYEKTTATIRSVPENYCLGSVLPIDGAPDYDANAEIMAAAFEMRAALRLIASRKSSTGEKLSPVCMANIASAVLLTLDMKLAHPQIVVGGA